MGKQTSHFFDSYVDVYGHKKFRLKTIEQYARERNTNEQPGKQYFKATTLPDIINQAPMPNFKSARHGNEMEKGTFRMPVRSPWYQQCPLELNNRASFIDFCQGLLNLNPIERWSPQQARQHPFITGEKYTKPWSVSLSLIAYFRLAMLIKSRSAIVASECPPAPAASNISAYGSETTLRWISSVTAERNKSLSRRRVV